MTKELDLEQTKAIKSNKKNILTTGLAGTGKTWCLANRVVRLINDKKIKPNRILVLTFYNSEIIQIKKYLKNLLSEDVLSKICICTLYELAKNILKKHGNKKLNAYYGYEKIDLKKAAFLSNDVSKFLSLDPKFTDVNIEKSNAYKNELITLEMAEIIARLKNDQNSKFNKADFLAYHFTEQFLISNNIFTPCDVEYRTYLMLNQNEGILKPLQQRFKHVLVDDVENLNLLRFKFIELISKIHQNVYYTGNVLPDDFKRNNDNKVSVFNLNINHRNESNDILINDAREELLYNDFFDYDFFSKIRNIKLNNQDLIKFLKQKNQSNIGLLYDSDINKCKLEQLLMLNSIPYNLLNSIPLYQSQSFRLIVNLIDNIFNPNVDNFNYILGNIKESILVDLLTAAKVSNKLLDSVRDLRFNLANTHLNKYKKNVQIELSMQIDILHYALVALENNFHLVIDDGNTFDIIFKFKINSLMRLIIHYCHADINKKNYGDFLRFLQLKDYRSNIDMISYNDAVGIEFDNVIIYNYSPNDSFDDLCYLINRAKKNVYFAHN